MIPQMTTGRVAPCTRSGRFWAANSGKGARTGCLAGNVGAAFPTAYRQHRTARSDLQTLDQGSIMVGMVSTGFGDKTAGDGRGGHPVAGRRPRDGGACEGFSRGIEDDNELLELGR